MQQDNLLYDLRGMVLNLLMFSFSFSFFSFFLLTFLCHSFSQHSSKVESLVGANTFFFFRFSLSFLKGVRTLQSMLNRSSKEATHGEEGVRVSGLSSGADAHPGRFDNGITFKVICSIN